MINTKNIHPVQLVDASNGVYLAETGYTVKRMFDENDAGELIAIAFTQDRNKISVVSRPYSNLIRVKYSK